MAEYEAPSTGADPATNAGAPASGDDGVSPRGSLLPGGRRRPAAVTVVAVTYLVLSIAWAVIIIRTLISAQVVLPPGGGVLDMEALRTRFTLLAGIVAIREAAVGVTAFVGGIALLQMHPRGWLLGMVAAVVVLAVQLVSWYDAMPNYVLMTFGVAVVLLMNQNEVRDAFGEGAHA